MVEHITVFESDFDGHSINNFCTVTVSFFNILNNFFRLYDVKQLDVWKSAKISSAKYLLEAGTLQEIYKHT